MDFRQRAQCGNELRGLSGRKVASSGSVKHGGRFGSQRATFGQLKLYGLFYGLQPWAASVVIWLADMGC